MISRWIILLNLMILNTIDAFDCTLKPNNAEGRIKQKVLCDYDKSLSPYYFNRNETIVTFFFYVHGYKVIHFKEKIQISAEIAWKWMDSRLKWNSTEFDNIQRIYLQPTDFWVPVLEIFDGHNSQETKTASAKCEVSSNGDAQCDLPCTIDGICKMDYFNWPYGLHNCTIHIGTSALKYEGIKFKGNFMSGARHNDMQWKLIHIQPEEIKSNNSSSYQSKYTFVIDRHAATELTLLLPPSIILVGINLLGLLLEPRCSERFFMLLISFIFEISLIKSLYFIIGYHASTKIKLASLLRNAAILNGLTIVETFLIRWIISYKTELPKWVLYVTNPTKESHTGRIIVTKTYVNKMKSDKKRENKLSRTDAEDENAQNPSTDWIFFIQFMDKIWLLFLLVAFIVMFIILYPTKMTFDLPKMSEKM